MELRKAKKNLSTFIDLIAKYVDENDFKTR
jgi:hypothetical protein